MTPNEKWDKDRGSDLLILNYPLDENSQIIELGGYHGYWTKTASQRFNCNILSIEPVPQFYNKLVDEIDYYIGTFNKPSRDKIKMENCGISTEEKTITLYMDGDATSSYLESSEQIEVECHTLQYFLKKYNITKVDLIQINIEGEEYPLLENWIEIGILNKIKYIQIQFHKFGENYEERRKNIQDKLSSIGFEIKYNYDFVWESWENKKI